MAGTNNPLRRRAAWAVLAPVLDEDALIDALWLQHDNMRGESVSDIIAFVDAVSARHMLDVATRKRLYSAYFDALRQPDDNLPIDPWPLMLQTRPSAAPVAPMPRMAQPMPPMAPPVVVQQGMQPMMSPVGYASYAPGGPVPSMAPQQPAQPAAAPAPPPAPAAPEPAAAPAASSPSQAIFGALVSALMTGVRQFHPDAMGDLLIDCRARLDHARLSPGLRQAARDALVTAGGAQAWYLEASEGDLSTLVHEFYVALCESLGPVDADHVLMQAVRHAEQLPQAREFSPSRFL